MSDNRMLSRCVLRITLLTLMVITPSAAFSSVVNVNCNDNSGDSTLINNAITGSHPGDEIVIHGPGLITSTIVLLGGRRYSGDSNSTVLTQGNGANLTAMLASDSYVNNTTYVGNPVQISNLDLEGNSGENTAATVGIMLRSWLSSVKNVVVDAMGGDGIRETNLSANGTALTNSCVNCSFSSLFIENCKGNGFRVVDTGNTMTDSNLEDTWIASSGTDAIDLDNAAGWVIERDHVYGVPENAIVADRMFNTTVSDNYIEDFGSGTTAGSWFGIYGTLQGGVGSVVYGNRINCFSGEPQTSSSYYYLDFSGNYGSCYLNVTGNQIVGAATTRDTGIDLAVGSATGVTVTSVGNAVADVHTTRAVGSGVTVSSGI